MRRRETEFEFRERMKRFEKAKSDFEFFDTGIGRFRPDALSKRCEANAAMWENANAPAWDEYRSNHATTQR